MWGSAGRLASPAHLCRNVIEPSHVRTAGKKGSPMTPWGLKTAGYLVSTVSVMLLGAAAWPGAERAGLEPVLVLGMATSVLGMASRWYSYHLEKRHKSQDA